MLRADIGAGDGHQAPALGEASERGCDVSQRCVGHATGDVRHRREWRVHQHDRRDHSRVQMIVDLRCVEARDCDRREEGREEAGAGFRQFVEDQSSARNLGQNGEQTGPGGRFEHTVGRCNSGRARRDESERDGRRELLERLAFEGAAGVRGKQTGDFCHQRQGSGRRAGFLQKRFAVFAEEENGRCLAGVVGQLPVPGSGSVARVEARFHRVTKQGGVDTSAGFEMDEDGSGGIEQGRHSVDAWQMRRRPMFLRAWCGTIVHREDLEESGNRASPRALSLDRPGSNPSRPPLPLDVRAAG